MLFINTAVSGIQIGLCYALIALGMYIAYSILDFPDLTTDGSFPLGGVIGTILIYRAHIHPLLALVGSFAAGAAAGGLTGTLHVKFRISKLLSGIIVMTALLSVTLALTKLLNPNGYTVTNFSYIAYGFDGIFNRGTKVMNDGLILLIELLIVLVVKFSLDLFLRTKAGFLLIATGNNEVLVSSLGKDAGRYKIFGLSLANGLTALGGGLYAQLTMNYDNTSGNGKVVLALAAVIIGLAVFSRARFVKSTTAVIVGAVIYSLCLNFFTLADTDGTYLKLLNAIGFALILILTNRPTKRSKATKTPEGTSR